MVLNCLFFPTLLFVTLLQAGTIWNGTFCRYGQLFEIIILFFIHYLMCFCRATEPPRDGKSSKPGAAAQGLPYGSTSAVWTDASNGTTKRLGVNTDFWCTFAVDPKILCRPQDPPPRGPQSGHGRVGRASSLHSNAVTFLSAGSGTHCVFGYWRKRAKVS